MRITEDTRRRLKRSLWRRAAFLAVLGGVIAVIGGPVTHKFWGGGEQVDVAVCPINTCVSVSVPGSGPSVSPGGVAATVPLTITNLTNGPVYVNAVTVTFTNTWQSNRSSACTASQFQLTDPSVSGSVSTTGQATTITFPRQALGAKGSATGVWIDNLNLAMLDNGLNQEVCVGQPLTLSYSATAQYTVPTTTVLAATQNAGSDSESLTATVAPDIQPSPAGRAPGNGDGTVNFWQCSTAAASSCTTLLGSTTTWSSSGVASISLPAGNVGSYQVEAQYVPQDQTSFVPSSSPLITETLSGCVQAATGSATTIIRTGQTISGNYTIPAGSSVWLNGGTITGNVTVAAGASLAASGGTIGGNVQSNGGQVALAGTAVNGNVQGTGGGISVGPATVVKGNLQLQGGGPFCSQGTSATQGQVQIRGNLLVQSLASSTTSTVCSTVVGNNLQWQQNASPGLIGSCGANTVLGNLQVQNNSGKVTVSSNAVSGNVLVQSNTGGGTVTGNSATGNCLMQSNTPAFTGQGNSGHQNSCNGNG
jgi:hypothetical protein